MGNDSAELGIGSEIVVKVGRVEVPGSLCIEAHNLPGDGFGQGW